VALLRAGTGGILLARSTSHAGTTASDTLEEAIDLKQSSYGRETGIDLIRTHADRWIRFQRAIPPMVAKLREESTVAAQR
jgi:hypothetical protein